MLKKLIPLFLSLIAIISCSKQVSVQDGVGGSLGHQSSSLVLLDDAGCPQYTDPDCSRCEEAMMDVSKVSTLCQNYAGIPGGIPSAWVYGFFTQCVCGGPCASECGSSCSAGQSSQYIFDSSSASDSCITCIQTVSDESTCGCGLMFEVCSSDIPL